MNIKKNFILNTFYQVLNIVIPLITTPYLARVLGASSIGTYSFYYTIANYFMLFILLGLTNYGNRSIAYANTDKKSLSHTFWSIYTFQAIFGFFIFILYLISTLIVFKNSEYQTIALINSFYVLSAVLDINWFFFGVENFKLTVTRNCLIKILTLLSILMFIKCKEDLPLYTFIMAFSSLLNQLMLWPFLKQYITFCKPTASDILSHIKPNLTLFIPVIAVSLYKMMDKIMLGILSTQTQLGFYEYTEKIINIPTALITALGTVMLPRISNLISTGKSEISLVYIRNSMQFSFFFSFAVCFGLSAIAPNLVIIFLGSEFKNCDALLSLLSCITIFISCANVLRTQYLIPFGKDKIYIYSVISGAIINFVINLCLIKHIGASGAAIGTIIAEFTVMLFQIIGLKKQLPFKIYLKDSCLFPISGLVMYFAVKYIGNLLPYGKLSTLIIQIILGIILYFTITIILYYLLNRKRLFDICKRFL